MTLDNLGARPAAIKLDGWFPKENPAPSHGESREDGRGKQSPSHHTSEPTSQNGDVKYMASIDVWFNETFKRGERETDVEYWARTLKATKSKLVESFRAGKLAA